MRIPASWRAALAAPWLALVAVAVFAADGAAPTPAAAERSAVADKPIPLVIVQREVVRLRATVIGYGPGERVEGARHRLISAYERNKHLKLALRHVPEGVQVTADGAVMFTVVPGDVNALAGETPEIVAERALERLRTIVAELEERGDPQALLTGGGLAVAATLLWVLLLRAIMAFDRWAGRRLTRAFAEGAERVKVSGVRMFEPGLFMRNVRRLVRVAAWGLAFVVSFLWLNAVLESVPYTRPWGERLTEMLVNVLVTLGTGVLEAMPGLFFVLVIVLIARLVVRAGASVFDRVREERLTIGWLDADTAPPTRMVFTVIVWLFALAMAYPYLPGSQTQAFQGLSVLVGLMVSIGASSTVGQAASGLILMYTRAYRVGEFVRIQETEGTVVEVGLFATRVRTGMGEEVMLPNTMVLGNSSKNYSRAVPGTGFVLDTVVTIGYDTPWRQVHAMLTEAAGRVPTIAALPAPRVVQTALTDFYPEYRLVAYSKAESAMPRAEAMGALHAAIQDVFNEYGVQIMSPHYLGDPAEAKVVPKARWFEAPAKRDEK